MPAYMIVKALIRDREAFVKGYGKAAAALVAQFGGRYIVRAPGATALEESRSGGGASGQGSWDGASVVISEWPDRAAAIAFWTSPEYAEARKLREGLAEVEVMLVEVPA